MQVDENASPVKAKQKRGAKKNDVASLLRKIAESATELAQHAERASQSLRQEAFRSKKNKDRLRIVLHQYTGILDVLKRVTPTPTDADFLVSEGFIRAKKERSE